jgi:hypothetical protein
MQLLPSTGIVQMALRYTKAQRPTDTHTHESRASGAKRTRLAPIVRGQNRHVPTGKAWAFKRPLIHLVAQTSAAAVNHDNNLQVTHACHVPMTCVFRICTCVCAYMYACVRVCMYVRSGVCECAHRQDQDLNTHTHTHTHTDAWRCARVIPVLRETRPSIAVCQSREL